MMTLVLCPNPQTLPRPSRRAVWTIFRLLMPFWPRKRTNLSPSPEPEMHEPLVPSLSEMAEEGDEALALSLDQVIDEEDSDADTPDFALTDDVAFVGEDITEPEPPEPEIPAARMSTMPDPTLTDDLAEHLLDSTAQAAASNAFSRLGVMSLGAGNQTIEGIVRELLRPMLKSWLDENLPAVVERLVEREIERVSRGGR